MQRHCSCRALMFERRKPSAVVSCMALKLGVGSLLCLKVLPWGCKPMLLKWEMASQVIAAVLPDDSGVSATRAVEVKPREAEKTGSALMATPVSRFQRQWRELQDKARLMHLLCTLLLA